MHLAVIIVVAAAGVCATAWCALRMWRASRSGAPRELVLGYLALMVIVAAASMVVLRLL